MEGLMQSAYGANGCVAGRWPKKKYQNQNKNKKTQTCSFSSN